MDGSDQGKHPSKIENVKTGQALLPYTGNWSPDLAAHLLRRTIFGATYEQIKQSAQIGLEATLNILFSEAPPPTPPINYYDKRDRYVPIGQTWINAPYGRYKEESIEARLRSLKSWTMSLIFEEGISIREKLTLFWQNHFAVSKIEDPKYLYRYISILRSQAWGNFRELIKTITIDPAMLRFLNGYQNTAKAPNENFARELLELFTIGKGAQVGKGDYTNYTEKDIVQIARILTGWQDTGSLTTSKRETVGAKFQPDLHDKGTKELSYRFDNKCISDLGAQEYLHLIDLIFQQKEVARFICRKLYRWFVYYAIDKKVEAEVIEPMAQILIENNFEIKPALLALLRSRHFYDPDHIGAMIKNPIDFFMSVAKTTHIDLPTETFLRYRLLIPVNTTMKLMQMDYFDPPNVAGWPAYYQEPLYYRTWINAANLSVRAEAADRLAVFGQNLFGFFIQIDVLAFLATLDNPKDLNELIKEIIFIFFPKPLPAFHYKSFKNVLIDGLPDAEWAKTYQEYLTNPHNKDLVQTIERKLRLLFKKIISIPEFNLS